MAKRDSQQHLHLHYQVAIIGAGPAGQLKTAPSTFTPLLRLVSRKVAQINRCGGLLARVQAWRRPTSFALSLSTTWWSMAASPSIGGTATARAMLPPAWVAPVSSLTVHLRRCVLACQAPLLTDLCVVLCVCRACVVLCVRAVAVVVSQASTRSSLRRRICGA